MSHAAANSEHASNGVPFSLDLQYESPTPLVLEHDVVIARGRVYRRWRNTRIAGLASSGAAVLALSTCTVASKTADTHPAAEPTASGFLQSAVIAQYPPLRRITNLGVKTSG